MTTVRPGGRAWWVSVWMDSIAARFDRRRWRDGVDYAASGLVSNLRITPNAVGATVHGSSIYRASIRLTPLPGRREALAALRDGGDRPEELDEPALATLLRDAAGFPSTWVPEQMACTCPDFARGFACKHLAATWTALVHRCQDDPRLLLTLRDLDTPPAVPPHADLAPIDPTRRLLHASERFWSAPAPGAPSHRPLQPRSLARLGSPPWNDEQGSFIARLQALHATVVRYASALALPSFEAAASLDHDHPDDGRGIGAACGDGGVLR